MLGWAPTSNIRLTVPLEIVFLRSSAIFFIYLVLMLQRVNKQKRRVAF